MSQLGPYAWLQNEPAPRILVEAVRLFGVTEVAGNGDNPRSALGPLVGELGDARGRADAR